jgi:hypothetical protein
MRITHTIPVLLVAALSSAASAKTVYSRASLAPADESEAITFGHADKLDVDRADLSLTTDGDVLRGSLRIVLSTWDDAFVDRSILIAVPNGTEVRSLGVTIGAEHLEAVIDTASSSRMAYEDTVRVLKDPALLEWVSSSTQKTWLRLRVFPVRPNMPATIELGLALRRKVSVAIDPGMYRIRGASISVDGDMRAASSIETSLAIALPAVAASSVATTVRTPFVSRKHSLFAGPNAVAGDEEVVNAVEWTNGFVRPVR